ncbi:MAG: DUF1987 domain-containing protein [Bacteroidales bacterium]|nr:DUF1987 domain-containing protein [Bacteroidales bacterium]
MKNLEINPTFNTPSINFNAGSGYFLMQGRSIPEDPDKFYEKIMTWMEEYFDETSNETNLEFRLEYVNSGSSKYILELLRRLHKLAQAGKLIKIIWCFETDDESIEDLGEHYKNTVDLPFEIREIDEMI